MIKHAFRLLMFIGVAATVVSCAKSETMDFNNVEEKALAIWIENNAPNAQPLGETGMYYEVLESGASSVAKVDVKGKWVQLDYVMRNLDGDIFYNRNEKTARLLGTYNTYARYILDRIYISGTQAVSNIPSGIYQAITEISPGEMWRVYIPSRLAFASSGLNITTGYGGQKPLEVNVPIILDSLKIVDVIDNPVKIEEADVIALATSPKPQGWGKSLVDTVKTGYYLDFVKRGEEKDSLKQNQSASIYYKVRFLDGTLIYSNIDTVLVNNFGRVRSGDRLTPIRITRMKTTPINQNEMPAKVFYDVLDTLRYGDQVRVLVNSRNAYYRHYMRPNMNETEWEKSTAFVFSDGGKKYDDYSLEEKDYFFARYSFYVPYSQTAETLPIAEIKPYTPLIYEFEVVPAE